MPDKDPADGIAAAAFDLADRVRKLTLELQTTKGGLEETSRQLNDVSQNRDKIQRHLREAEQLAQDRGRLNEILERDVNTWKRKAEAVRLDPLEQENTALKLRVRAQEKDLEAKAVAMEEKQTALEHHKRDALQWKSLAEDRDLIAAAETHSTAVDRLQSQVYTLERNLADKESLIDYRKREHAELYEANNHNLSEAVEWKQKALTLQQQVVDLTKERDTYEVTLSNRVESYFDYVSKGMYQIAKDHGFHEGDEKFPTIAELVSHRMSEYVANIHGEVSELWEAYRKDEWHKPCDKKINGQPIGLTCAEEELADISIRAMDVSVAMNINLGRAIRIKANYNKQRPYKHGGKKA